MRRKRYTQTQTRQILKEWFHDAKTARSACLMSRCCWRCESQGSTSGVPGRRWRTLSTCRKGSSVSKGNRFAVAAPVATNVNEKHMPEFCGMRRGRGVSDLPHTYLDATEAREPSRGRHISSVTHSTRARPMSTSPGTRSQTRSHRCHPPPALPAPPSRRLDLSPDLAVGLH